MKRKFIEKIGMFLSYILLIAIMATMPINNNIICLESDGTSSIENAPLGSCQINSFSDFKVSSFIENTEVVSAHDGCFECTDVPLFQSLLSKLKSETDYTVGPGTLFVASTSFKAPIFTEPFVSFNPNQEFIPNQLHKHIQTIIFLI